MGKSPKDRSNRHKAADTKHESAVDKTHRQTENEIERYDNDHDDHENEEESGDDEDDENDDPCHETEKKSWLNDLTINDDVKEENHDETNDDNTTKKKKKIHKLSLTKTHDFNETLRKRGVIYMARIPPRMNPAKVKHLLSDFGCGVTRIYLVEEDATIRKQRRKRKSSSGAKRYVEGWIEFEDKKVAKRVAMSLNNTIISNQKGNVHFGDLWNLKYLHQFQWEHLTEKVAYERRVREQKLRVELFQARRENAAYTQLVETGQKLDTIEARRKRKHGSGETTVTGSSDGIESERATRRKVPQPRQIKPLDPTDKAAKGVLLKSLV